MKKKDSAHFMKLIHCAAKRTFCVTLFCDSCQMCDIKERESNLKIIAKKTSYYYLCGLLYGVRTN